MKTDVLIIGGGLVGCAAAYFLAREGAEVVLIERFDLNTQASGSNAGSIHAQIPHEPFVQNGDEWARTFAPTIPLMMRRSSLRRAPGWLLGSSGSMTDQASSLSQPALQAGHRRSPA